MASVVSICNQAISWCSGNRIISLDDGTTEANLCKDNFDELRDAVLEDTDWTFATKRFIMAPEQTGPVWGYGNKFLLSDDVLRVIAVSDSGDTIDENTLDWQVEEEKTIVANVDVIYVKAIVRITDVTKFTANFRQALAARIAADALALPLTGSRNKMKDMWALYGEKLANAKGNDGRQGRTRRMRSTWLTRVR